MRTKTKNGRKVSVVLRVEFELSKDGNFHILSTRVLKQSEKKQVKHLQYNDKIQNLCTKFLLAQKKLHPSLVGKITDTKIDKACDAVDKLTRIDGYSLEEITKVLKFALHDEFWSTNVLSPSSLRNKGKNGEMKFVNILASMQRRDKKYESYTGVFADVIIVKDSKEGDLLERKLRRVYLDMPGDARSYLPNKAKYKLSVNSIKEFFQHYISFLKQLPHKPNAESCLPVNGRVWRRFIEYEAERTGWHPITGKIME